MKIDIKGIIVPNDDKWIYDWMEIGAVSPKDVATQIANASAGEELEVEINSGGGDVYSGSEIYTALKGYAGNVLVKIVGVAASAASVIAMAGKKVVMSPTAQFMIHNVASGLIGDHRAFEHEAIVLKSHDVGIANAYILKTGMTQKDLLKLMDTETFLNAQEALKNKFIDEIMFDEGKKLVASIGAGIIPQEVINKMRNYLKANEPLPPKDDSRQVSVNLYQAQILLNRRKNNV